MTVLILVLLGPTYAVSEQFPVFQEKLPVASINRERLFAESAYGQALLESISLRQNELVAENSQLFANLEREERELTELRKAIEPAEFTPLAAAFDAKANQIRQAQALKVTELNKRLEKARFTFFRHTEDVIRALMIERGILYVLNEQAILMSTGEGNITGEVMARLDAQYSRGDLQVTDE